MGQCYHAYTLRPFMKKNVGAIKKQLLKRKPAKSSGRFQQHLIGKKEQRNECARMS